MKKRKDGRYQVVKICNGERYYIYARTTREMRNKLRAFREANCSANRVRGKTSGYTFADWVDEWIEVYKKPIWTEETLKGVLTTVKQFKDTPLSKKKLKNVKPIDIMELLNSIPQAKKKKKFYTLIHSSLLEAYANDYISVDIARKIKFNAKYVPQETVPFTKEQAEKFIRLADTYYPKWSLFYKLMLYEGLRPKEVGKLKLTDIDFELNCIHITNSKTRASTRNIPIFDIIREDLIAGVKQADTELLCPEMSYRKAFANICEIGGITGVKPYSLRHTFATRCHEYGVDDKTLQVWMGHSDIKVTMNTYVHFTTNHEKEQINLINTAQT